MNDPLNSISHPYTGNNIEDLKIAYSDSLNTIKIISEELEKQKLLYSNLFNLAPEPYFLLNQDGVISDINIMGGSLLGLSNKSLIGEKLSKFLSLDYIRDLDLFLGRLAKSFIADKCELTFERPDKTKIRTRVDGATLKNNGRITYHLVINDLSKKIDKAQRIEKSNEQLELSLEASHAGTWELEIYSMNFYLILFNSSMSPMSDSGFDGRYRTFINYIHPDDRQTVEASFRKSIDSGSPIDVVCRFPARDGKLSYYRVKGELITDSQMNKRLAGIIINVTAEVLAEQREAEEKANQQKLISMATIQAGENERRLISDMLHDSVNQLLYGVKLKLDDLKPQIQNPGRLVEIDGLVDQAINDMRNISFTLAPSILVDFGLPATLKELADRLSTPKMQIKTYCFQNTERPNLALELNIFRIVQELINNCIKHADASLLDIRLRLTREIKIEVSDNGKGFNYLSQTDNPSGSGLSSIKNRLALYNGVLKIDSKIGDGTLVTVTFG